MSKFDNVTVKCVRCGVRIVGKRTIATGEVHAARQPKNDAPVVEGTCMNCLDRCSFCDGRGYTGDTTHAQQEPCGLCNGTGKSPNQR